MPETRIDQYQVSLKVFLRNKQGKTLILKAPDHWSIRGYYDVPGGRINDDEMDKPLLDIIRREIVEEIGVQHPVIHPHPVGIGRQRFFGKDFGQAQDFNVLYIFFEAETDEDVQTLEDYAQQDWVDIENIDIEKTFPIGVRQGAEMYITWLKENRSNKI